MEAIDELPIESLPAILAHLAALQARTAARLLSTVPAGRDDLPDELLDVDEAAERLGVGADWLYRRADTLPFARRLSPRALRFSGRGIERWIRGSR